MQLRQNLRRQYLLAFSLSVCVFLLNGCLESSFQLSSDSRLPVWFKVPAGMTRNDVSVTLNYYSNPSGPNAKLILKNKTGDVLKTLNGDDVNLTQPGVYPAFVKLTIGGQSEIIEHRRMEPIFFVSDDPKLKALTGH